MVEYLAVNVARDGSDCTFLTLPGDSGIRFGDFGVTLVGLSGDFKDDEEIMIGFGEEGFGEEDLGEASVRLTLEYLLFKFVNRGSGVAPRTFGSLTPEAVTPRF